ncbi:polysaccharide deacetylase family protein [Metabacillus indicus]|uniref:polysaccharide deacetylase family protein n=1 Tax=Metabacillus indicus TaxID=246786 RepID=UPI003CF1B167
MRKALCMTAAAFFLAGCTASDTFGNNVEKPPAEKKAVHEAGEEKAEPAADLESEKKAEQPAILDKTPKYKIDPENWSLKPLSPDVSPKAVLLTIDDAPDQYSVEMAQTLKKMGVKAIFFVNGHFLDTEEEKARLKEIYQLGFPIGNHTMTHSNLKDLTPSEQKREIAGLNDLVEQITGERPRFFRAPFGSNTDESRKIAEEEKMVLMNWTYGYDWESEYQSKEALTEIMINTPYLTDGANLLMHDRKWTSEALSAIVTGLKQKGYEMADPDAIETPL